MNDTNFLDIPMGDLDRKIYRIMPLSRVVDIFKTRKLGIARTDKWDDPFENYLSSATYRRENGELKLGLRHTVHGMCWTKRSASDAMWRIYSLDKMSVRLTTTPRLLGTAISNALQRNERSKWFIGRVRYIPQNDILKMATDYAIKILKSRDDVIAAKSFLYKRNSFSHEEEIRLLIIDRHQKSKAGIMEINIDPHKLFSSILFDSRAPDSVFEIYNAHFKNELGYKGRINKSTIYTPPIPLEINLDKN